ncbi:MAG: MucR family transcriptional regulator [Alphaproteobacteria bacterium]|nr:MucR family transcriptional regulator [Alphaproteobacteria bacterium]
MDEYSEKKISHSDMLRMTTDVVAAYVARNDIAANHIQDVINTVYSSLRNIDHPQAETRAEPQKPAISIKKSVQPDFLICLEDGKKLKMLKRHLRTMYNMSPDEYRAKWGLPPDYPMVAENYANQRSAFAKQIGLGKSPKNEKQRRTTRS